MSGGGKKKPAGFRTRPGRDGGYEVGYGKPPEETRFKKGQSGNPKGRPKGAKTRPPDHDRLASIFLEEAYREITLRDGGREVSVPMVQAAIRTQFVKSARGTARSAQVVLEMLRAIEDRKRHDHEEFLQAVITYKTECEAEIADRKRRGLPEPDLDIHPDHLVLDLVTGTVDLIKPLTDEERKLIENIQAITSELEVELDQHDRRLKRTRKPENAERIIKRIAHYENMLASFRSMLPQEDPNEVFKRQVERDFPTKG
jgi:hypothetical protein